ncbi:response regulator [Leptolyngbya ohadii]|uniref:response regulator n=1 Tax=Leptolyngbya ohadii TaxID=1962290 RepID=UPI000B59C241|nr:PleD family two-component system response regulator [Leptolyngbya ohadii]
MTQVSDPGSPPLVLVIDDDRLSRMQMRLFLEREGYRVEEAVDGEIGLLAFQEVHPDLVMLDTCMPFVDGFSCCFQLRCLPSYSNTPILMVTEQEDHLWVDRLFEAGAADYVARPIQWAVLRQRVRRLIQQAQLQRQLELANQELQRLVTVDELTQVANRRRFDEYLEQEWQRTLREQQPLSLILCDVDCFKAYNDTYGHPAGDRCLQQVAQLIRSAVKRPGDLVARYGGEEFAVILPNTNAAGAVFLAETICQTLRWEAIPHPVSTIAPYITLSAGVGSTFPTTEESIANLIQNADQALYCAKKAGKDRAVLK